MKPWCRCRAKQRCYTETDINLVETAFPDARVDVLVPAVDVQWVEAVALGERLCGPYSYRRISRDERSGTPNGRDTPLVFAGDASDPPIIISWEGHTAGGPDLPDQLYPLRPMG
ncbi:hypothetical protein D9756_004489 [Leucocoprinus leucothites]|uniref:Uncharacterized protein n=1 Tax=Leucocoprinus leucothites TaxID=201217 RepID=A0A8H5G9N1_9AGAR|nr:hypothetical protein D9756_004489 [Leucoagaricus leucothites]